MKTRKMLPFLLAVALVGCVPSLHPLFTDSEIVFEEKLLGVWKQGDKETWEFKRAGPNSNNYEMIYTNDGEKGPFVAMLGKINDMMFLDLYPDEVEIQANDFYKVHLLPAHTFLKIEQIQPTLKMRAIDPEKFNKMLTNDPNLIRHEVIDDDRVVITASTQELQQFMKEHANDEGLCLFGKPTELKRLESVEPNAPDANNVPGDSNGLPV
jgi:DNA-directed RNA polymerase subunit H (RpoH/RPB5)